MWVSGRGTGREPGETSVLPGPKNVALITGIPKRKTNVMIGEMCFEETMNSFFPNRELHLEKTMHQVI